MYKLINEFTHAGGSSFNKNSLDSHDATRSTLSHSPEGRKEGSKMRTFSLGIVRWFRWRKSQFITGPGNRVVPYCVAVSGITFMSNSASTRPNPPYYIIRSSQPVRGRFHCKLPGNFKKQFVKKILFIQVNLPSVVIQSDVGPRKKQWAKKYVTFAKAVALRSFPCDVDAGAELTD